MIEQFYEKVPAHLRNESGAIFNAGRSAFSSAAPIYLLGLNPGGDPARNATQTIEWHTRQFIDGRADWSAYRDESWDGREAGTAGMQPRILHMLWSLGLNAHDIPASNVVFQRTRNEASIASQFAGLADECWAFHNEVITRLCVRVVVCFGARAAGLVRKKTGANSLLDEYTETNNRGWKSKTYGAAMGLNVVMVTHPSRANWLSAAADPTELVRRALERTAAHKFR